jgi:hypothetical protein
MYPVSPPSPSSPRSIQTPTPEQESNSLQHTRPTCRPKEVKEVRFQLLLSPPPDDPEEPMDEDTLPPRDQVRRSQRLATKTVILEDKEAMFEFGSAVN